MATHRLPCSCAIIIISGTMKATMIRAGACGRLTMQLNFGQAVPLFKSQWTSFWTLQNQSLSKNWSHPKGKRILVGSSRENDGQPESLPPIKNRSSIGAPENERVSRRGAHRHVLRERLGRHIRQAPCAGNKSVCRRSPRLSSKRWVFKLMFEQRPQDRLSHRNANSDWQRIGSRPNHPPPS
jgi:hypothetical protein